MYRAKRVFSTVVSFVLTMVISPLLARGENVLRGASVEFSSCGGGSVAIPRYKAPRGKSVTSISLRYSGVTEGELQFSGGATEGAYNTGIWISFFMTDRARRSPTVYLSEGSGTLYSVNYTQFVVNNLSYQTPVEHSAVFTPASPGFSDFLGTGTLRANVAIAPFLWAYSFVNGTANCVYSAGTVEVIYSVE